MHELAIARETNWAILPYDPVPYVEIPRYPGLGNFGLLLGLLHWGILLIVGTIARNSVHRMPLNWRNHLVEYMNAKAEAKVLKESREEMEGRAEAERHGLIYTGRTNRR